MNKTSKGGKINYSEIKFKELRYELNVIGITKEGKTIELFKSQGLDFKSLYTQEKLIKEWWSVDKRYKKHAPLRKREKH